MSIEQVLRDFLAIKFRDSFDHDFKFVYRGLVYEESSYIENGEVVMVRKCDHLELSIVSEIDRFVDELAQWRESVKKIAILHREKPTSPLPKDLDYREAFGDYCDSLEEIRSRCRRILKYLPKPTSEEISRKELLLLLGIKTSTLTTRIEENGFPKPVRIEGRKQWFSVSQVDEWRKSNRLTKS